jgi:hypothetical protein
MNKLSLVALSAAAVLTSFSIATADVITTQVFTSSANPSGGITVTIDNQGTPNDGNGHVLNGYTAYEMTITANTTGWLNSVVDFGNERNDSFTGFNGPLAIQAVATTSKGTTTYTPILSDGATTSNPNNGTYYSALGSHFLYSQSANVAAGVISTNFTASSSLNATPSDSGYAFGSATYLRGATGFYNANRLQVLPFAYLVIPNGQTVSYNGQDVVTMITSTTTVNDSINFSGTIPVPEPATVATFALGGLAILTLGRKRKQA